MFEMSFLSEALVKLMRRKDADGGILTTNLRRCLSTLDIAFLGIGNMLGSGVYILAPNVANKLTGPAIVLSFLLAGIASLLAALAYAEFGVRFPRSGSAYSYTYFALGEILAFFVGWNLIMENVLSLAVVGRTCSAYANSLSRGIIGNFTVNVFGWLTDKQNSSLSKYPDVLSAILLIAFVLFMLLGAKQTSWLNNTLVVVNVIVMAIIFGVGVFHADFSNWQYHCGDHKPDGFISGFLPHGWSGVLSACAKCFFAYVGFDSIAAAGEEARNPGKSIPIATLMAMSVVSVVYISVSGVLTLMLPYYDINTEAGIPDALKHYDAYWAVYMVSGGAIASMVTVIMGTIFAVSRVMYAMAEDGLLPAIFCSVCRKVPFVSMITSTFVAAILAVFFDTDAIIEMLSIGTLFAYLIIAFGVVIVRYSPTKVHAKGEIGPRVTLRVWAASSLYSLYPSRMSHKTLIVITLALATFFAFAFGFSVNVKGTPWDGQIGLTVVCGSMILVAVAYIYPLKELLDDENYTFQMPLMPLLPVISMSLNAFLMTTMEAVTWYRFIVWLVLGATVYFANGYRYSKLNQVQLKEKLDHS
ncbi:cationic amino acid transporter 4-like isoform X1 [Varroa destructor]|uniref:Cationic amino acid transporter C-terminal domain-containing protein n=1 Tax=Varroa destructor TaxID=109461 RepID=A0A7M7JPF9_VARDE|nr:cationic amino acid transporter 4-like isoform X1 [Varroa destructor]XP_022653568.1 cationic amino acid transporter 4-like isoform X1 [Varroa destructor]XP_022653569.1 cationic amino acid transporter 4-like isoform X1 [Varroa destructor]XP_022653571.1 cationic amino acid transporter 4-like isoform X1 [Varroa destructor]